MYRDLRKELIIDYKHRCLRGQSAMTRLILMFLFILGFLTGKPLLLLGEKPEIVSVKKIWDQAPHNAFTDLIRFQRKWFCIFREADFHGTRPTKAVMPEGKEGRNGEVRVIVSENGENWKSVALLREKGVDLRDPKLSVMADGRLMLLAGGIINDPKKKEQWGYLTRSPRVAFSKDGINWTPTQRVLAEDHWLWRATWYQGKGYALSKMGETPNPRRGFLYWTTDGLNWQWLTEFKVKGVSETTLRVMPNGEMLALIRPRYLGRSLPPYKKWIFNEIDHSIGGPNFIRITDGSLWAASRLQGKTVLSRMTTDSFDPVLTLPSGGGDTSYPGMVWHDQLLWISYYSSHEGQSSIYLAQIRFVS